MNTKPATPLPWRILQGQDKDGVPRVASKDGGVAVLCINRYMGEAGPSKSEQQQAAYIVHACNSMPGLVEALLHIASGGESWKDCAEVARVALHNAGIER